MFIPQHKKATLLIILIELWKYQQWNGFPCNSMGTNPSFHIQYGTRQLPMGAGYCQWGGLTDRNIYNHSPLHVYIGPLATAGEPVTHARKERRKARKYI